MRRLLTVLLLIAAVSASGCRSAGGGSATVVATTTQVADMTRAVAGARVTVKQILQPNADPHEYEPRPSDALAVAGGRMVVGWGPDVDGWLSGLIGQAGGKARVVNLIDSVH